MCQQRVEFIVMAARIASAGTRKGSSTHLGALLDRTAVEYDALFSVLVGASYSNRQRPRC